MKNCSIYFVTFIILLACTEKKVSPKSSINKLEVLDGFGKAKLGMTTHQFEKVFHQKIILTPSDKIDCFQAKVDSLKVGPTIFLEVVLLEFNKNRLFYIGTSENPQLFDYLKRNFKIASHTEDGYGFTGSFITNSNSIFCSYEYVNGSSNIGVYRLLDSKN